MARKLPADSLHYYVGMGAKRSYQAVADKYQVNKRTVTRRARNEDWQKHVEELEAKASQAADERAVETLEEMNTRHLRLLRVIQGKALEALRRMPLSTAMEAVRSLEVSIRQERLARGEPSDRTAIQVEDVIKKEYERWMVVEDDEPGDGVDQDLDETA